MKKPVIEIENLFFSYEEGQNVIEDVSFQVMEGDFLGLVGPNGGGKSTLLKLLLGLLSPKKGKVLLFGLNPQEGRARVGYVPQFKTFSRIFPISVEETVLMGRLGKTRRVGNYTAADRDIVRNLLVELHIEPFAKRAIGSLSGGELQRVMIARALAAQPEILLLDEPSSSTDPYEEENLFDLLKKMNATITILLVSHDIGFISHYINRVACINRRLVCHQTTPLTQEMIEELYQNPICLIHHHKTEKP